MTQFSLDQCSVFQISPSILTMMTYLVYVRRLSNDTWWKWVKFTLFGDRYADLLLGDLVWSGHLHRDGAGLVESLNLLCWLSLWISVFSFSLLKVLKLFDFFFHLVTSVGLPVFLYPFSHHQGLYKFSSPALSCFDHRDSRE